MKKLFTFLCLISSGATTAQSTFKTLISIGNSSRINDVVQINDGSYIGVGYQIDSSNMNILISKFSPQGVLLFSKLISTDDYNEGISIIKTRDGGFAVGGSLNGDLGILKFDQSFNLQWQKVYPFSHNG